MTDLMLVKKNEFLEFACFWSVQNQKVTIAKMLHSMQLLDQIS